MTKYLWCNLCGKPKALDNFAGEGGMGAGLMDAGFCVDAVDNDPKRLALYPRRCPGQAILQCDALSYIVECGSTYALLHGSPTCTGYSRGTAALPDRLGRYDRLIGATREAMEIAGRPYVIENVADARPELRDPIMLCGRMFGLTATDTDGTVLTLDRHRLFETSWPIEPKPHHSPHGWKSNRRDGIQVAGSYGGARRDKHEARYVRKGGYVPASVDVQRELLGTPWMSEKGCQLSIPPAYGQWVGHRALMMLWNERIESL